MEKKTKTEITIETDRTLVIRAWNRGVETWCATCRETRTMMRPEEAVAFSGMSARVIYCAVEAGEAHFVETNDGMVLVCLQSLGVPPYQSTTYQNASQVSASPYRSGVQVKEEQIAEPLVGRESPPSAQAAIKTKFRRSENSKCPPGHNRHWVLTKEALEGLLTCLDANREAAGQRYEAIRRRLLKYFECRGCLSPEDLADETLNRVARRVSEGKVIWASNPTSYFYGVASNVLKEYWGRPDRDVASLECLPLGPSPREEILKGNDLEYEPGSREKQLESLEECLRSLRPETRELIIQYYEGEKGDKVTNRKRLAEALGLAPNTLRIKVYRIREKLERDFIDLLNQKSAKCNKS